MALQRSYHRSMRSWWRRDRYFLHYMAREATAPFVAAYALVLVVGLARLATGRAGYEAWIAMLASPASIALHALLVAVLVYHSVTWFRILPKTLPPIAIAGRRLGPAMLTGAGLAVAALASALLWLLASGVGP
jgi:fumarate reductase subunit C